eukprot:2959698-Rhodomonas_salina.1
MRSDRVRLSARGVGQSGHPCTMLNQFKPACTGNVVQKYGTGYREFPLTFAGKRRSRDAGPKFNSDWHAGPVTISPSLLYPSSPAARRDRRAPPQPSAKPG